MAGISLALGSEMMGWLFHNPKGYDPQDESTKGCINGDPLLSL
jgi:hypothetical protein